MEGNILRHTVQYSVIQDIIQMSLILIQFVQKIVSDLTQFTCWRHSVLQTQYNDL